LKNSILGSIEGLPQGVRAGVFLRLELWRKLRRDRVFEVVEEKLKRASALKR
jgi:hypothetical protein